MDYSREQRLEVRVPAEWRRWLRAHHRQPAAVWLVFLQKHTGERRFSYAEALEEALCYGWIDGIVKKLDDRRYQQRFSPRRPGSNWSEVNLKHVRRLIDEGRMQLPGLEKLGDVLLHYERGAIFHRAPRFDTAPEELLALLEANPKARETFRALPPSHRRRYLGWVLSAKREATRRRRMTEVVDLLARGERLGMK
jgi:uncharacterized protein YdeI (YjbR/CyaY-like superfamily)